MLQVKLEYSVMLVDPGGYQLKVSIPEVLLLRHDEPSLLAFFNRPVPPMMLAFGLPTSLCERLDNWDPLVSRDQGSPEGPRGPPLRLRHKPPPERNLTWKAPGAMQGKARQCKALRCIASPPLYWGRPTLILKSIWRSFIG